MFYPFKGYVAIVKWKFVEPFPFESCLVNPQFHQHLGISNFLFPFSYTPLTRSDFYVGVLYGNHVWRLTIFIVTFYCCMRVNIAILEFWEETFNFQKFKLFSLILFEVDGILFHNMKWYIHFRLGFAEIIYKI